MQLHLNATEKELKELTKDELIHVLFICGVNIDQIRNDLRETIDWQKSKGKSWVCESCSLIAEKIL